MKYTSFTVENYKGIEERLTLNVSKTPLIPIIGVNECGKTTILQAIFGFDFTNDALNQNVRHLEDTKNRYKSAPLDPKVSAEIEVSKADALEAINSAVAANEAFKSEHTSYKRKFGKDYKGTVKITRNLTTKKYTIDPAAKDSSFSNEVAKEIIKRLPYILFFDDFRDSIDQRIEIKANPDGELEGWLAIIDRLFKTTDEQYDILELPTEEDRDRKGIISNVNRKLEKVLTDEWKNFRLEDREEALKIRLDYEKVVAPQTNEERHYIKFDVVEKDSNGQEYFFYIRDRSKGFYWFFNFVMKLEFNPKVIDDNDTNAIYLLDEPGSYLHAHAQVKLCNKLKSLSKDNKIIYCTHSHYLLNPEVIPINSIRVAVKDPNTLHVSLKNIHEFDGLITDKKSAFQPINDALQIKPFGLNLGSQNAAIVEGIYDYYCFEMFKDDSTLSFIPGTSADSIKYLISLMIAWGVDYRALWDGDSEGRKHNKECVTFFGEHESKRFFTLDTGKKLQDLFQGSDISLIRKELDINGKSSFEKTIVTLFYSEERTRIIGLISAKTKRAFKDLIEKMQNPLS